MANLNIGRKSGFIIRSGVRRRETIWVGVQEVNVTLAAANSAALINTGGVGIAALRPFTVVRTRLTWFCRSDQTGALESYQAALGVAVVTDQASAIGITAVPTPFTDIDSDIWLMHETVAGIFLFISGSGVHPVGGTLRQLDSKAMRKVEDGFNLSFMLENSGVSNGTTNLTSGRVLLKLH